MLNTLVTRTSYKYDLMNRKIEEKDEVNSVTTTYTYNWRGFNRTISGPEGYFLKLWYDNLGRVTGTKRYDTDVNGTLFSYTIRYFDEMGRVYRETTMNPGDTESSVTKHYYSKGGRLLKTTDPYSKSTTYTYDGAGRRTKTTDPLGNETVTAYYDDGSVKYTRMKNKIATDTYVTYSTAYWYDADGRREAAAEYGTGGLPGVLPSPGGDWRYN